MCLIVLYKSHRYERWSLIKRQVELERKRRYTGWEYICDCIPKINEEIKRWCFLLKRGTLRSSDVDLQRHYNNSWEKEIRTCKSNVVRYLADIEKTLKKEKLEGWFDLEKIINVRIEIQKQNVLNYPTWNFTSEVSNTPIWGWIEEKGSKYVV